MEIGFLEIFILTLGAMIGVFIGYFISVFRIRKYLKTYYPDVDFQQSRTERLKILEEQKQEKE